MNDLIRLKSGREFYANCTIVGISEDLKITEGYDGGIHCVGDYGEDDTDGLTKQDQLELADLMIDRWNKFKLGIQK